MRARGRPHDSSWLKAKTTIAPDILQDHSGEDGAPGAGEEQPDIKIAIANYSNAVILRLLVLYYSRGSYGPDERVAYLKETDVLVRRPEGWKIVHIHVSGTGS